MAPRGKKTQQSPLPLHVVPKRKSFLKKNWTREEVESIIKNHDNTDWEVKAIIGHEYRAGYVFYLVDWKGNWDASYEPASNLTCENLLNTYHDKIKHDPRKYQFYQNYDVIKNIVEKRAEKH